MSIDRTSARPVVMPYTALPFHLGQGWGMFELTCKACGNSCISRSYTCHQPPGCACDG